MKMTGRFRADCGKKHRRFSCWGCDSRFIAGIKGLVAGGTNTILAISLGASFPAVPELAGTLLLVFLGYGVSLVLFIASLLHLGTARTGEYFSTAPFVGSALALILYGQPPWASS